MTPTIAVILFVALAVALGVLIGVLDGAMIHVRAFLIGLVLLFGTVAAIIAWPETIPVLLCLLMVFAFCMAAYAIGMAVQALWD